MHIYDLENYNICTIEKKKKTKTKIFVPLNLWSCDLVDKRIVWLCSRIFFLHGKLLVDPHVYSSKYISANVQYT